MLSLAALSHGIVAIFVAVGMLLLWLIWMDRTRLIYGMTVGATTFLLAAFWMIPFFLNHQYMTDMKYGFRPAGAEDSFWDMFFPLTTFFDVFITTFAVIGFASSIVRRHLNGAWLGICGLAFVAGVYVTRDSLPGDRAPLEPAPAAVRVPPAVPADDGRHRRDGVLRRPCDAQPADPQLPPDARHRHFGRRRRRGRPSS